MNNRELSAKYNAIRGKGAATRLRHAAMRPFCVQLKLDMKCLNRKDQNTVEMYFVQSRWLCNYLIAMNKEEFEKFDLKTRSITSLDKDGNKVERTLTMPAKFIQSVYSSIKNDIAALAAKKMRGRTVGKLKFRSSYDSIDLNQYGNTHWIVNGNEGDRNGKYRNTVHIAGIRRPIRVFGMDQIPEGAEFANAKLLKKPSGYYLALTCFTGNASHQVMSDSSIIGIDFGIRSAITTSDGETYDISVGESERLKGLQRKLARQMKGSAAWYDTRQRIRREYERLGNRKKDIANKTVHELTKGGRTVVMQDENIKGWHHGRFSRQVQHSALGTVNRKLKDYGNIIIIDRSYPSTKLCPVCGHKHSDITLSDRIFTCTECGYTCDRDVKSARLLLMEGMAEINALSCAEYTRTPVERMSGCSFPQGDGEHSALRQEAPSSIVLR